MDKWFPRLALGEAFHMTESDGGRREPAFFLVSDFINVILSCATVGQGEEGEGVAGVVSSPSL